MDNAGKIKDLIRNISGATTDKSPFFIAKVKSVEGDTCTVNVGILELTEVRLRAVIDDADETLLITPQEGSMVLVADLSNGDMRNLCVIKYTQVDAVKLVTQHGIQLSIEEDVINVKNNDKVEVNLKKDEVNIKNDNVEVNLKDDMINVQNGSYSLKEAFSQLIETITKITVPTGVGPSGPPTNIADFINIQTKLDNFLS